MRIAIQLFAAILLACPAAAPGASEYAKDGLVPIVELTGRNQWFDRLRGITEDIFKNANFDTPYGRIPSDDMEVNGELLQVLPRLYAMTGEKKYLDWAHRLAVNSACC
jgi:DUF1680 family protein